MSDTSAVNALHMSFTALSRFLRWRKLEKIDEDRRNLSASVGTGAVVFVALLSCSCCPDGTRNTPSRIFVSSSGVRDRTVRGARARRHRECLPLRSRGGSVPWARALCRSVSRRDGLALELANIRHGPQLALILQLRATELFGDESRRLDADFFRSALGPGAPSILHPHQGFLLAATVCVCPDVRRRRRSRAIRPLPPVVYAADDPICPEWPAGARLQEITAFMERDVMPFARRVLAPLVGGAEEVTCETCHGADAVHRNWKMPGVRALPEPELRFAGLERARLWLDPQMRNAVYGYLAEEDNQSIAAYMRHDSDARHGEGDEPSSRTILQSRTDTTDRAPPLVVTTAIWSSKITLVDHQPQRWRWPRAPRCSALVAILNCGGYRYGIGDQAFYVPAVVQHLNPEPVSARSRHAARAGSASCCTTMRSPRSSRTTGASVPVLFFVAISRGHGCCSSARSSRSAAPCTDRGGPWRCLPR